MEAVISQRWEAGVTQNIGWYVRVLPSLTDLAFLLPAIILFHVMDGAKNLLADGDTGWHIRTGEWILQHRSVPRVDLFSFTKPHEAWFAWEWGWDTAFALVHKFTGLGGVAFVSVCVLCAISALLFRLIRNESGNDILALGLTVLCMCGSTLHWLARPHLFGWLFLLIFCHVLLRARNGQLRGLRYLPVITLVWTNVHGSFFVGLLLLLVSGLGEALEAFRGGARWRDSYQTGRPYVLCWLACAAATLINPYTWHLHAHVLSYLQDSKQLAKIQEFQSIDFHSGSALFFECMLLPGCAAIFWCIQRRRFSGAINIALWAHWALASARNVPIFLFVAAPSVACMFQELIQDLVSSAKPAGFLERVRASLTNVSRDFKPIERMERWHLTSFSALLLLGLLFAGKAPGFEASFNKEKFPEGAIPVLEATDAARVFTYDQWGDYLIYRLFPSEKVFVDGRSDFYGSDFIDDCLHVINARYDWQAILNRYGADTVLLKADAPVATLLKQAPEWKLLMDDGVVLVFQNRAIVKGYPASGHSSRISPGFHNGGNKLGAFDGLQVDGSISNLNTHERRSL